MFPAAGGRAWTTASYKNWSRKKPRGRVKDGKRAGSPGPFAQAAAAAGAPMAVPYDLRHSYVKSRRERGAGSQPIRECRVPPFQDSGPADCKLQRADRRRWHGWASHK